MRWLHLKERIRFESLSIFRKGRPEPQKFAQLSAKKAARNRR
jgi:hypothetical protein